MKKLKKDLQWIYRDLAAGGIDNSLLDQKLDKLFCIHFSELVSSDEQLYPNLSMEALSSSYRDYFKMLNDCEENLIDLGAGYGRGSFLSNLYEEKKCISVEKSSRIDHLVSCLPSLAIKKDLLELTHLGANQSAFIYLAYDELIVHILKLIKSSLIINILYVIESHGDLITNLKCYSQVLEYKGNIGGVQGKRHDPLIHKFKVKKEHETAISLFNKWLNTSDRVFNVRSWTINFDSFYDWSFEYQDAYPVLYNGQETIYIKSKSRYLNQQRDKIDNFFPIRS